MLHRTVKENDINKDKWIGVGGHFEKGESPEECLLREVWEETGYTLKSWRYPWDCNLCIWRRCSRIYVAYNGRWFLQERRLRVMKENWNG